MVAYWGRNPKIFARNCSFVASRRIRGKNLEPFFLAVKKNPRRQYLSKRECWYLTDWNPSKSLQRRILKRLCFCIVFHLNFVASFKKDFFFSKFDENDYHYQSSYITDGICHAEYLHLFAKIGGRFGASGGRPSQKQWALPHRIRQGSIWTQNGKLLLFSYFFFFFSKMIHLLKCRVVKP